MRFEVENSRMCVTIDGLQAIRSSCVIDLFGKTRYAIEIPSNSPVRGEAERNRFWQYAAHHAWIDEDTLFLTVCWQETGHFQTWKFHFLGEKLALYITDGLKGMFEIKGAVSDRNMRFADMIFDGELQTV